MGTSTNAILFYGYVFDDEGSRPYEDDNDEDWESRYARLSGLVGPEEPYPDGVRNSKTHEYEYTPEEQKIVDKHTAFWDKQRKLVEKCGVVVDTHCSCDCPMPFVAVTKSKIVSHRGEWSEIKSLDVGEDWNQKLKDFCQLMGIKTKGKPKWYLVSDWC